MTEQRSYLAFVGSKGGVGTTAAAAQTARLAIQRGKDVVLVDMTGDLAVVLGELGDAEGLAEMLRRPDETAAATMTNPIGDPSGVRLLSRGRGDLDFSDHDAVRRMWDQIEQIPAADIVVDAGQGPDAIERLKYSAATRVLTVQCCYQSLARARDLVASVDQVLVQTDPSRALGVADIEATLGRHADAVTARSREVSRWMDAGLILTRPADSYRGLETLMDTAIPRRAPTAQLSR